MAFVVDIVSKRYIVDLGVQERVQVREGANSFVFSLDRLDVSRVKRKHLLNNAGLLVATLVTGDSRAISCQSCRRQHTPKIGTHWYDIY